LWPVAVRGAPATPMRLTDRMKALNVPGVSVAVIDGGRIAWARAWGVARAGSDRLATPSTLFQAASISKPVTAVAALRWAAGHQISLDEDVNARLRTWHLLGATTAIQPAVTARALLSHTAGLDEDGLPGYGADAACPDLLHVLRGAPPATNPPVQLREAPGLHYAYSSLGYAALQQYLIDATGQSFDRLVESTVIAPVAMRDSIFATDLPPALAARAAAGHALDGTPLPGGWNRYPELAAAGLWTTASDLARFVLALQQAAAGANDNFLSRQQTSTLWTPVLADYGLGFELDHQGREAVFHHSGSNAGYKALLFAYQATGQGAVILTNGDNGWPLIEELMRSIAAEYGWGDWHPVERIAAPPHPNIYDRLAGAYQVSNIVLRVTRAGDRLYVSGPPLGAAPVELISAGGDDFFVVEKDATLHFVVSEHAQVDTITFFDGRPRPGKRVPDGSQPTVGY
jgi:CubicO group peptidase (beta-lactamase class C family)